MFISNNRAEAPRLQHIFAVCAFAKQTIFERPVVPEQIGQAAQTGRLQRKFNFRNDKKKERLPSQADHKTSKVQNWHKSQSQNRHINASTEHSYKKTKTRPGQNTDHQSHQ